MHIVQTAWPRGLFLKAMYMATRGQGPLQLCMVAGSDEGGHALTKSPITIDRPADNDRADECPKYVEPSVRVAVSEAEQSTKCSRD